MINLYSKNFNFNLSSYTGTIIVSNDEKRTFLKNQNIDVHIVSFLKIKSYLNLQKHCNNDENFSPLKFPLKSIERFFPSKFIILEDLFIENMHEAVLFNAICDFILHEKVILYPVISSETALRAVYDNFEVTFNEDLILETFRFRLRLFIATRLLTNGNSIFISIIDRLMQNINAVGFSYAECGVDSNNPYLKFIDKDNVILILQMHPLKNIPEMRDEFVSACKIILHITCNDIYFNHKELINKIKIFPIMTRNFKNIKIKRRTLSVKYNELSKIQSSTVKDLDLPQLVIAGAGAGKTRLIVNKFLYLSNFVSADEILILTFTNSAVEEIINRIEYQRSGGVSNLKKVLNVMTYHSFFYSLIREYYTELGFKSIPLIAENKFENSGIDFISYNDIILNVVKLLKNFKIAMNISSRFRYILVDECQDLDFLSDIIIKKIDFGRGAIMYAGDDDQAIYAFNGGNSENLLFFDLFYPSGKLFVMRYNYRSNQKIINFCNLILNNISFRFPKIMAPAENKTALTGKNIINIINFKNKNLEEKFIIDRFNRYVERGENAAILVRTQKEEENFKKLSVQINIKEPKAEKRGFIGTIHKCKGMEFDVVFIVNVSEGNMPNLSGLSKPNIKNDNEPLKHPFLRFLNGGSSNFKRIYEDEIKLFYVAVSRAKKTVFITYSGAKSRLLNID